MNTAVAKELLESELGYKVETKQMDETPAWDAMSQGKIDAILEDWGHPEEVERYVDGNKTVVPAGDLGVVGHIGWFVPKYLADQYPDLTDHKNLNKYKELFKTPESGDKGQFIKGDPSYVSHDNALIKNLKLDYRPIEAGAEATHLAQLEQLYKSKKPFLTYWWTPQWMNATMDLVEVKLPAYQEGCDKDEKAVACAYPQVPLKKWMNADFAKKDSDAAKFLKKVNWSTRTRTWWPSTSPRTRCPLRTRQRSGSRTTRTSGRPGCRSNAPGTRSDRGRRPAPFRAAGRVSAARAPGLGRWVREPPWYEWDAIMVTSLDRITRNQTQ